jgi:hypothetical protein
MAAISDNKYEIYEWVKKVMDSCETPIQLTKAQRLIKFFTRIYNDQFLRQSLYDYKDIKWRNIIEKLNKLT